MSTADWFAKKLGGPPPPSSPPLPGSASAPVQYHAPPQPQPQAPAQPVDPNNIKPGDPGSFTHALATTTSSRGGDAHRSGKVVASGCPSCGSGNYLELKNGPSCFDCGYPVVQEFSPLGEGTSEVRGL